jgi:cytochrome b6-f complex iron-sulfur subunit
MERKYLFTALAGSSAFICFGGLAACTKAAMNLAGQVSPFKIDPSTIIANVRDSMVKGSVIIVRIATGDTASSVTMLSNICTHQGFTVNFNASRRDFECSCHASAFNTNRVVTGGPASSASRKYAITITELHSRSANDRA